MAASITGVFTIIDRASAPMRRMESQALKTMAAIEGVGHAQDKQSASHQSAGRRMEETTRVMRNAERQATTTGRSFDQMGRHMNNSNGSASGFIRTISKVNEVFRFLAGAFAMMKLPTMAIGFTVLAQAIGQLAGGAVALVPALAQASAAMAALPQTASAAVQGLGVFKLAMGGVQNALKAGMAIQQNSTQVMQDAAQAHIQAVHGVQEAEFSLATSQRTVQQAQQALTQARRDAIRNLTDLRLAAMGADLSQRRAALSLREAQQNLAQAAVNPGTTDLQMQDLNLAVSEARLQVRSAGVDRNRAHVDAHRAAQRGVDRNLQVIQAQQGVIQSMHAERDAVYELQQAQVALAREMQRGTGPIQNWRQALAQLSPQAQSFVKHIVSLQPAFKGLRAAAGSEMFPGFEKALNNLMRLMPVAKSVSRDTGGAIGGIAEALSGRLAGRSGDLKSIGESNIQIIRRMGLGAGNLGSALLDLMVAAKPFTSWLTHTIYMGTEWISKWSRARRESGAWADMLDKTRARLKQFADIGHNLWEVLTNVLKAATPLGDKLWSGFDQATKGWAQFARTTGQSKMRHWFDALYPGIHALAKLTEDLLKAWAHITVNPGFATTINNLDKAVPALQKLFTAGTNLGPGLANTLSSIAQTLSDLPFSSLQLLLDVIDNLSKLLDFIIRKVPGAKYLLAGLLLGPMIVKGLNFVRGMRDAWADIFGMWSRNRGGPPGMGGPMGSPMGGPGGGGGGGGGFRRTFGRFGGTRAMTEAEQATLTAGGRVAGATEEGMVAVEGAGLLGKFGGRFPRAAARLGRLPGIGRLLGPAAEGAGVLGKAAEGGGLLGKAAGLGKFAMPALGVAAKFALPLMALQGLLAFGTFKGNVGQRLQNVASSFSFGLVHAPVTDAMKRQQGQQDAASYVSHLTGGEQGPHNIHEAQMRIGAIRRQVGRIRSRDMAGTVNPMTGQVIPGHIGTKDLATIKTLNRELKDERKNLIAVYDAQDSQKAQEFGSKLSGIWSVYHKSTKDTGKATKQTVSDIENQMSHMHRAGRTQLAQQAYDWTKEFARTHKGMSGEMKQAREDILNHLRQIGDHATVINGQILTSTSQVWSQIGQGLSDPIEKAREKVAKGFTRMQRDAIKALTDMGMTRGQAEAYVAGTEAMNAGSDMSKTRSQRIAGAINAATGSTGGSGGAGSYNKPRGATGMRIPGQGTLDTVPLMLGMAAPGELIVNRHTEDRVRRRYGVDLGREVASETRAHSAPANATPHYGIMPGFATGGRLGNAASMIAAANAINAHHFPYVWGGGHNPNFTGPYDCSGSVSAVLHAGGVLNSPVTSGSLMGMFDPGPGEVTIYANPQHTYMSIGSRFFGTSTMNPKGGAGWFAGAPRPGFVVRHVPTGGRGSAGQTQAIQDLAAQLGQSVINAPDLGPGMAAGVGQVGVNAVAAALNDRISGAGGGGINATAYGGGGNLRGWLTRALRITGHYSSANLAGLTRMAMGESSGNPNAVQRIHDVNSGNGGRNLARGLLQTIPSTFSAYSMTGHNNIMDPVDNAIASIRYQFAKYGRIVGHAGYATGGRIPEWGGWHAQGGRFNVSRPTIFGAGEAGPETVTISRGSGGGRTPVQVHIAHIAYHREGDIKEAIRREMESLADDLDLVGTEGD